jgi:hypothetical protein
LALIICAKNGTQYLNIDLGTLSDLRTTFFIRVMSSVRDKIGFTNVNTLKSRQVPTTACSVYPYILPFGHFRGK